MLKRISDAIVAIEKARSKIESDDRFVFYGNVHISVTVDEFDALKHVMPTYTEGAGEDGARFFLSKYGNDIIYICEKFLGGENENQ